MIEQGKTKRGSMPYKELVTAASMDFNTLSQAFARIDYGGNYDERQFDQDIIFVAGQQHLNTLSERRG